MASNKTAEVDAIAPCPNENVGSSVIVESETKSTERAIANSRVSEAEYLAVLETWAKDSPSPTHRKIVDRNLVPNPIGVDTKFRVFVFFASPP